MTGLIGARVQALLTQAQLARKARVAQRTIVSIEAGKASRLCTQRRLLKALGIPFERRAEVFGGPIAVVARVPRRVDQRTKRGFGSQ